MEKKESSYTVGGNVSQCSHYEKQYGGFIKKSKTRVINPTIGIHPIKTIIRKATCIPMFIAALFTIAKTWKQLKCPLTDEWIRKM